MPNSRVGKDNVFASLHLNITVPVYLALSCDLRYSSMGLERVSWNDGFLYTHGHHFSILDLCFCLDIWSWIVIYDIYYFRIMVYIITYAFRLCSCLRLINYTSICTLVVFYLRRQNGFLICMNSFSSEPEMRCYMHKFIY